jgi:mannose-6-phosphate isomerase-like protein (cupin superfamily)
MVLGPGSATGGPNNMHANSDQWLYVIAGQGEATVNDRKVSLRPGSLLLIEAQETHEISNTGDHPLETLNIYTPPAY